MKVLFLNTRKKRIDCGALLRIGRRPDVIVLAELLQGSQRHYEAGLVAAGYKHCPKTNGTRDENCVDVTHVDTAADAHLGALDALLAGRANGKAYFLSQGEPVNLWDF